MSSDKNNEASVIKDVGGDPNEDANATATEQLTDAAAAAAPNNATKQVTLAQAMETVETLVQVFGFSVDVANHALNEVGADVTECCNFILDQGLGKDTGGAVYPIDDCPHVTEIQEENSKGSADEKTPLKTGGKSVAIVQVSANQLRSEPPLPQWMCSYHSSSNKFKRKRGGSGNLKEESTSEDETCPLGENWLCLTCNQVFCSRYVNAHGLQHWKDTQSFDEEGNTVATNTPGHCVAVSLADLSVWCHVCSAYLVTHTNPILKPIVKRLEQLKFPSTDEHSVTSGH